MDENQPEAESLSLTKINPPEVKSPLNRDNQNNNHYASTSDDVALLRSDSQNQSKLSKIWQVLKSLTIEPIVFCFMFGYVMNMTILTNFRMDIACKIHLNYPQEVCKNLSVYPDEKIKVEVLATDFTLYTNLLSLLGALAMIFIAPWSDKYGRKLPLFCAVVGIIITDIGLILCTVYNPRLEYLLMTNISFEVVGGFICVMTIVCSHASEVSTEKNRTLKYTSVEIAMGLGMTFGALTGGFLFRYYGYFYVYVTVACLHIFCLFWIGFVVEETTGLGLDLKFLEKAKDLFVCNSFKDSVKTTFKKRDGTNRILIILLLLSMCFIVLNYKSFQSFGFVYVHHIYDWNAATYSDFVTAVTLIQMALTLLFVPIMVQVFKIKDFSLGIIGTVAMIVQNFIISFAKPYPFIFYLGQVPGFFGQLGSLAIRAGLSKLVQNDELGKIFSFLATCEAIIPLVGNIAVTKIFEATLDIFPNIAYIVAAFLLLVPLATFVCASILSRRSYVRIISTDPAVEKVQD